MFRNNLTFSRNNLIVAAAVLTVGGLLLTGFSTQPNAAAQGAEPSQAASAPAQPPSLARSQLPWVGDVAKSSPRTFRTDAPITMIANVGLDGALVYADPDPTPDMHRRAYGLLPGPAAAPVRETSVDGQWLRIEIPSNEGDADVMSGASGWIAADEAQLAPASASVRIDLTTGKLTVLDADGQLTFSGSVQPAVGGGVTPVGQTFLEVTYDSSSGKFLRFTSLRAPFGPLCLISPAAPPTKYPDLATGNLTLDEATFTAVHGLPGGTPVEIVRS